jgi:hypothetical protein
MGTVSTFLAALLLSLLVSGGVGVQLAIYWNAKEEFIAVLVMITAFALIAIVTFAIAYSVAKASRMLHRAAVFLVVALLIMTGALVALVWHAAGPVKIAPADITTLIEFLVPALLTILIQWALIARRWRKLHPSVSPATN